MRIVQTENKLPFLNSPSSRRTRLRGAHSLLAKEAYCLTQPLMLRGKNNNGMSLPIGLVNAVESRAERTRRRR